MLVHAFDVGVEDRTESGIEPGDELVSVDFTEGRTDAPVQLKVKRGDKDIDTVADLSGAEFYCRPSCKGQSVKGGVQTIEVTK